MTIQKRNFITYMLLNCLTLGIYGAVVSNKIGQEIDALCEGDGEEPRFGFFGAVMLRGIAPILGAVVGLIAGLVSPVSTISVGLSVLEDPLSLLFSDPVSMAQEAQAISIFQSMLFCMILFTVFGAFFSGMYLNYWWYKQASRLKVNACRYGLVVKENGSDTYLFRTGFELLLLPATNLVFGLTLLIPALIVFLCGLGSELAAVIFAFVFAIPVCLFSSELTAGAYGSMYFIIKNLNRFADAAENGGGQPFDPMAYTYYPSVENHYPRVLPQVVNGTFAPGRQQRAEESGDEKYYNDPATGPLSKGLLLGEKGSCAGYAYDLNNGEEIIIGKDAKVSSIVIDTAYKEVSRKHVGVLYDAQRDQYCVTDYSSNGTWANGRKLTRGQPAYLSHNTELRLATDKVIFRLG